MPDTIPPIDPTADDVSEAAAEMPNGPSRRGRPRITPPYWDRFMRATGVDQKSRRTQVKVFHSMNAMDALKGIEGMEYVTGSGDKHKGSTEVLAELGQIDDPARIREAAACICEHRLKVKDAVALIRTWRNGGAAPGDADALADEIARVIRSYELRHPATTDAQVLEALEAIRGLLRLGGSGDHG